MSAVTVPLPAGETWRTFQQIHVDVARNASDDFNPFHDSTRWQRIRGNPFGGPIVLGFQLECLAEYLVTLERSGSDADGSGAVLRNYQFTFADVLRPGEPFQVQVRPTRQGRDEAGHPLLSNRVIMRKAGGMVLMGSVRDGREATCPVFREGLAQTGLGVTEVTAAGDRMTLGSDGWFHKRKYMMNGNAKNLISASLADQAWYFDEIEHRINFPDMVPVSMLSCALLERADAQGFDFYADPLVYTAHHISVDQRVARSLRSNDCLHILVDEASLLAPERGLAGAAIERQRHRCLGIMGDGRLLFGAEVILAPLHALTAR
ncbi:hypothetical protein LRY70_01845 [Ectothiorhodospira mobilis]|nr:hypothetical protein [Ectothiorhodospira mobilis]MCG5534789.1 hypothetical protein [Ectothiorhodospira mobilis]